LLQRPVPELELRGFLALAELHPETTA